MIFFTSSWDDGAIYDMKLSELLIKHNHRATFYIPLNNIEKRSVITPSQIRELSKYFEIGAHTMNHIYLNTIPNEEAKWEIEQSKKELELITGNTVFGFCFPGGKFKQVHIDMVAQAGFHYARAAKMFYIKNTNSFILGTTLQAYDHSKFIYYKNLLKNFNVKGFLEFNIDVFSNDRKWDNMLSSIVEKQLANDSDKKITIIHLWGHSWEIEEHNQWLRLENFLKLINSHQIRTKTNYEISNSILIK